MIKGVIFDLDNTLYSYNEPNQYAESKVCDWLLKKKSLENDAFYAVYYQSKAEIKKYTLGQAASHNRMLYFQKLCELMGWGPMDCALELYNVYWDSFLDAMELNDGVIELFEYLNSANIMIAICTELTALIQHRKVRKLGIENYVNVLVSSEEAGTEKNTNTIFDLTIEKMGIKKEEVLFVGDSYEKDVLGAQRAGIKSLLFDRTSEKKAIRSMLELKNVIIELNERLLL